MTKDQRSSFQPTERAVEALRCFPLPYQSASTTENYRRVMEWLYRDGTDRLITDLRGITAPTSADCGEEDQDGQ